MTTEYCSPTGNDGTGDGDIGNPYLTLRAAMDAAVSGGGQAIVIALPGDYDELYLTVADAGSVGVPTTVQSSTKWGAKITGTAGKHGVNMASGGTNYVTVDGFEITGPLDGVKVEGTNCIVENCWIHDTGTQGVLLVTGTTSIIRDNLIVDCGTDTGDHGVYCDSNDVQIYNNLIRGCVGSGIHCFKTASGVTGNLVYNNVSYGNGTTCCWIQGLGSGAGACGNEVTNNYFAVPEGSAFSCIKSVGNDGAIIANNILVSSGNIGFVYEDDCVSTVYTNNYPYTRIADQNTHGGAIDTTELVTNGGLENTTGSEFDNWTRGSGGTSTVAIDLVSPDAGLVTCKMVIDGSGSYAQITQGSVLTIGDAYVVELRAKADAACSITAGECSFSLTTSYQTYRGVFVAAATTMKVIRASATGRTINVDSISIKKAYGPELDDLNINAYWPVAGSRVIAAGSNTYKPPADFWGNTPPATVQVGPIPYTKALGTSTMLNNPWDLTKANTRWWDYRRRRSLKF